MVIVLHGLPRITCFTCLPGSSAGSCLHLLPQGKPKLFKCTSRRKIGRALYLKCLKGHCGDGVLLLKWRGIKTGRCEGICCDCRLMAFSSEDQSGDFFRRFIDYAVVTFERLYITKHQAIICLTLITRLLKLAEQYCLVSKFSSMLLMKIFLSITRLYFSLVMFSSGCICMNFMRRWIL